MQLHGILVLLAGVPSLASEYECVDAFLFEQDRENHNLAVPLVVFLIVRFYCLSNI